MKKKNIIASAMLALTMVFGMAGGMTVTPQLTEPVQAARRCNHHLKGMSDWYVYRVTKSTIRYRKVAKCTKCDADGFIYRTVRRR